MTLTKHIFIYMKDNRAELNAYTYIKIVCALI